MTIFSSDIFDNTSRSIMPQFYQPETTFYRNSLFRSRLEARWAVFFDTFELEWEYEPETFVLPNHQQYTPDFWIKNLGWIEIKPSYEAFSCNPKYNLFAQYLVEKFGRGDQPESKYFSFCSSSPSDKQSIQCLKPYIPNLRFLECPVCQYKGLGAEMHLDYLGWRTHSFCSHIFDSDLSNVNHKIDNRFDFVKHYTFDDPQHISIAVLNVLKKIALQLDETEPMRLAFDKLAYNGVIDYNHSHIRSVIPSKVQIAVEKMHIDEGLKRLRLHTDTKVFHQKYGEGIIVKSDIADDRFWVRFW